MDNQERIVFFDLETGGTDSARHPVIQFAGAAVDGHFVVLEELEVKIRFNVDECEEQALAVNSWDAETWERDALSRRAAVTEISTFLRRHSTVPMKSRRGSLWKACQLAGHNAATFDRPFLQALFDKEGEFCPGLFLVLDTLALALWKTRLLDPAVRPANHRLDTLSRWLKIPLPSHDALDDVRATVNLARELSECLQ